MNLTYLKYEPLSHTQRERDRERDIYMSHHFTNYYMYFHSERKLSKDFKGKEYYGIQFKPEADEDLEGNNDSIVKLMF